MKKKWVVGLFGILMVLIFFLTACGEGELKVIDSGNKGDGESRVIGFSQPTMESPFYISLVAGAKDAAKEAGVELIVVDAQNDIEKQNTDVQSLITKGIDVLLVNPVNLLAIAPALKAAEIAGIPLFLLTALLKKRLFLTLVVTMKKWDELQEKKQLNFLVVTQQQAR